MIIRIYDNDKFPYLEMAKVGRTESGLEIIVRSNDPGKLPHFHIIDTNKNSNNEGCIRIDEPYYFDHNGKAMHLNSTQRKELIAFLSEPFRKPKFNGTNFEYIVQLWNINNSDVEIDDDIEMPDYSKLIF